ncbi:D-2-hydroxyacid dehydrogenase [Ramlibacter sp. AW1]|uniref:D-2-hydroxyacid dehydrogenase n=1 Tax=Ramlibacter aurantiacus TaxID=2801330 RepID=A0A937D2L5_9BURK|nr:D-2-hydroxyacid dehydrogenase [Ramlibacter aurantiacus]MBL0419855.1 D-2-hydroxyacid dehydrogenase [Ramlibacter aurantiacus]
MKVVLASRVALDPVLSVLKSQPEIELIHCRDHGEVPRALEGADLAVLSDPKGAEGPPIVRALQQPGRTVRWVQVTTAGADGLLMHGPLPPELVLTNQGGAVAPTVAEHAMAMILAMTRQMPTILARSSRREWIKEFSPPLMALEGRTLAIVGYGHLGRQVAKRARGFDLKIVGLSRSLTSDPLADEMLPLERLHDALARADVVAVTVASVPATRHLLDATAFQTMKRGALLVNVSRGETVDQVALRAALQDGRLAGAFIDVADPEPLPADDPLWDAPNLIVSPHSAGHGGTRTGARIAQTLTENLARFRAGQPLLHRLETA